MTLLYVSGKDVDAMNLRSRDLDIRDIAHNLSLICRFTGAFPFHYSVGQHSILLAQMMLVAGHTTEECRAGLLHDAAEFVLNDMSSPIKNHPLMGYYRHLEHETSRMILANYGCNPDLLSLVKPYDEMMYQREVLVRDGRTKGIFEMRPATVCNRFLRLFDLFKG